MQGAENMATQGVTARQVKQGDLIVYDRGPGFERERVERVVRVTAGPRGYVHIRTDHCDRCVKAETEIYVLKTEIYVLKADDVAGMEAYGRAVQR